MKDNERIIVVAGNYVQFKYWLERNIIPIISKHDVRKLSGINIYEVHREGNWYEWMTSEIEHVIYLRSFRSNINRELE